MKFDLNLGFVTVPVDILIPPRKRPVERLFSALADHQALYARHSLEYVEKVTTSVERLRQKIAAKLDEESRTRNWITDSQRGIQRHCRDFLTSCDEIDREFAADLEGARIRNQSPPNYESDVRLVEWAERKKITSLTRTPNVNITEISPPVSQYAFIAALERLRERIGGVVAFLSASSGVNVPPELLPIIPPLYNREEMA
jgi:hypothetical protein